MMLQPWMIPSDLAEGDRKSLEADFSGLALHSIRSTEDPNFVIAYRRLWDEFGPSHEIEQPGVLALRMNWNPAELVNGRAFLYQLALCLRGREFVGVRDHTAIANPSTRSVIVHMSHNLVARPWRRTGIAGWLRALPLQTARACLRAQGLPESSTITFLAEMEHADPADPAKTTRLAAYAKAGYRKIAPSRIAYFQPDFRPFEIIDQTGEVRPLPLSLLVRRLGREHEDEIPGSEVREIVKSLYHMYSLGFRPQDMTAAQSQTCLPEPSERIPLIDPRTANPR